MWNSQGKQVPRIYNALEIEYEVKRQSDQLTLEVQQHLGENWVRSIANVLHRRTAARDESSGYRRTDHRARWEGVLGRVFNVTGDPWMNAGQ